MSKDEDVFANNDVKDVKVTETDDKVEAAYEDPEKAGGDQDQDQADTPHENERMRMTIPIPANKISKEHE